MCPSVESLPRWKLRFPGILWRANERNGLKFDKLIYPDQLPNWSDFVMINVANLHAICLWGMGSVMGLILGLWAFSGQQMEVMVSNLLCWRVLPTFSMDFIWVKSRSVDFLTLMYFVRLHGMAAPLCCMCKMSLKLFLKSATELFNQASFYLNESTAIANCYAWALWIWSIAWLLHIKGIISFVCKLKSEKPWSQGIPSLPV